MKKQPKRARDERGVSLVEILVAMVILTSALLSLASASALAIRTTIRGREDLKMWAAVQRKGDSLMARGAGNVASGSDVVRGRNIAWTVSGASPERIDLLVDRQRVTELVIVQDTVVIYLSN